MRLPVRGFESHWALPITIFMLTTFTCNIRVSVCVVSHGEKPEQKFLSAWDIFGLGFG